jgi:uncharacterized membrane protein
MKNLWLKIGCFLTGHNFELLQSCSEVSKKAVKKYMAALLIIMIVWSFIGFSFASRYMHADLPVAVLVAVAFVVIIIQVERQIILSITPNRGLYFFRGLLAILMAIIGAVIIDQTFFKDDIDQAKLERVINRVNRILPEKTKELQKQISNLDSLISQKEIEKDTYISEVSANPYIDQFSSTEQPVTIKTRKLLSNGEVREYDSVVTRSLISKQQVTNPKFSIINGLDDQIIKFRDEKAKLEANLLSLRDSTESFLYNKSGFLDELDVIFEVLSKSPPAMIAWVIWFFFFLGIELFILFSKLWEGKNDYDELIVHQMNIHTKRIRLLDSRAGLKDIEGNNIGD